jgi:hypothetical protein
MQAAFNPIGLSVICEDERRGNETLAISVNEHSGAWTFAWPLSTSDLYLVIYTAKGLTRRVRIPHETMKLSTNEHEIFHIPHQFVRKSEKTMHSPSSPSDADQLPHGRDVEDYREFKELAEVSLKSAVLWQPWEAPTLINNNGEKMCYNRNYWHKMSDRNYDTFFFKQRDECTLTSETVYELLNKLQCCTVDERKRKRKRTEHGKCAFTATNREFARDVLTILKTKQLQLISAQAQ